MVTAADTLGIVVHCDTTFNIFNGDQIAGGFGITDARHKLHPTAVLITKPKGLDTDKYKEDHEEDHGRHRRDCARRVEHRAPGG